MVGKQKFDNGFSGFNGPGGMGFDDHTVENGKCTAWDKIALPFDFDDAHPARPGRDQIFDMAKRRDVNAVATKRRQQHLPRHGLNFAAVDFNGNG